MKPRAAPTTAMRGAHTEVRIADPTAFPNCSKSCIKRHTHRTHTRPSSRRGSIGARRRGVSTLERTTCAAQDRPGTEIKVSAFRLHTFENERERSGDPSSGEQYS